MHLPKGHVLDTSGILDYLDTQASPVAKYLYILSYFVLLKDIFFCFIFLWLRLLLSSFNFFLYIPV